MRRLPPICTDTIEAMGDEAQNEEAMILGSDCIAEARYNKYAINETALTIERGMMQVISYHFFRGGAKTMRDEFDSVILESQWFSFDAKRNVFMHIVESERLVGGTEQVWPKAIKELDDWIRKVGNLRNWFTHGRFSSDGTSVWLSYFHQGSPQRQELTDAWLEEQETILSQAYHAVWNLRLQHSCNHRRLEHLIPGYISPAADRVGLRRRLQIETSGRMPASSPANSSV